MTCLTLNSMGSLTKEINKQTNVTRYSAKALLGNQSKTLDVIVNAGVYPNGTGIVETKQ